MHIIQYFVILYEQLQEIQQKFNEASSNHSSLKNNEKNQDDPLENNPENIMISECQEIDTISKHPEDKMNSPAEAEKSEFNNMQKEENIDREIKKENRLEEDRIIRMIYKKMIFILHPDKKILSNPEVFHEIKSGWDKNYYPPLFYHFIQYKNHPSIKKLFLETSQNKKFINILKIQSNIITKEINEIKQTIIWKAYYHPNPKIRQDAINQLTRVNSDQET